MLYRHGAFGRSDPEEEFKIRRIRREILFRYPNMDTIAERPTSNTTATTGNCVITRDLQMDGISGSLRQLQSQQAESDNFSLIEDSEQPKRSISRDDYGFRKSGISTPVSTPDGPHNPQLANELVPDPNGLGWPGVFPLTLQY